MNDTKTEIAIQAPVQTRALPAAALFVQPSELCPTQRQSMARDAFAALQVA